MKSFDLNAITKDIYSAYPEAERKPLIGITANYTDGDASLRDRYYTQIADAGGVPVISSTRSTTSTRCCSREAPTTTRYGADSSPTLSCTTSIRHATCPSFSPHGSPATARCPYWGYAAACRP